MSYEVALAKSLETKMEERYAEAFARQPDVDYIPLPKRGEKIYGIRTSAPAFKLVAVPQLYRRGNPMVPGGPVVLYEGATGDFVTDGIPHLALQYYILEIHGLGGSTVGVECVTVESSAIACYETRKALVNKTNPFTVSGRTFGIMDGILMP